MTRFEAFEESVEVNGQTVMAVVDAFPSALQGRAERILASNGIEDPQPDEWYPQQAWLDSFEELAENVGEPTLEEIGKAIPKNAEWPPGTDTVVGGLESIDTAYHMNHRNGKIGHYDAKQVSPTKVHVTCDNPYPCSFDTGIVKAVAKEFSDQERPRVVEIGDGCRSDGHEECVYEVTW